MERIGQTIEEKEERRKKRVQQQRAIPQKKSKHLIIEEQCMQGTQNLHQRMSTKNEIFNQYTCIKRCKT